MDILFEIQGVKFSEKDYQDNINEVEDILPIIQELQGDLEISEIQCVDINDCCDKTKMNYFSEIQGFITKDDEFVLKSEAEQFKEIYGGQSLDLFVIRIYKCVDCGKWIIDILE